MLAKNIAEKSTRIYKDRFDAGRKLAVHLIDLGLDLSDSVVIGLARGGVPVAYMVAEAIGAPFIALVIRKLGTPNQPELALGAIAPDGIKVLNHDIIAKCKISNAQIDRIEKKEREVLKQRVEKYCGGLPTVTLSGKRAILVDDGLATGATMRAAIEWAKHQEVTEIIVAAPVASPFTCQELVALDDCDRCICEMKPEIFNSVASFYKAFPQTTDEEVLKLLHKQAGKLLAKEFD